MNTAHLIFYVSDQERSKRFYRAVLEMEPRLDVPGMTEFDLNSGAVLGLMPETGIKRLLGDSIKNPAVATGIPRAELYLMVSDPNEFHKRAVSAGARELSPLKRRNWGHLAVYSSDPDGHVIAFACPLGSAQNQAPENEENEFVT